MSSTTTIQRVLLQPALPWEITDAIIDHLHSDVRALGICSVVCSEWLMRSRYHIFSTVQLWPWRVRRFFDLAGSNLCTFVNQISRLEVDDSRTASVDGRQEDSVGERHGEMLFRDAMAQSHMHCFSQIKSIQVRNVDWTVLSPSAQATLRGRLAKFSHLNRLEFQGAVFHDLREVVRIVDSFPSLHHLTANITFMKYIEHTIASAMTNHLSTNLLSLELGTDEAIPVILSSISSREVPHSVMDLKLQHINSGHLRFIRTTFKKSGKNLRHISLGFEPEKLSSIIKGDLVHALDFSNLSHLQTLHIEGLNISKSPSIVEETIAILLESVESSFFESVELGFHLEADANKECMDWHSIERALLALHFFGMKVATILVEVQTEDCRTEQQVERWIRECLKDLNVAGGLNVVVTREGLIVEPTASDIDKAR